MRVPRYACLGSVLLSAVAASTFIGIRLFLRDGARDADFARAVSLLGQRDRWSLDDRLRVKDPISEAIHVIRRARDPAAAGVLASAADLSVSPYSSELAGGSGWHPPMWEIRNAIPALIELGEAAVPAILAVLAEGPPPNDSPVPRQYCLLQALGAILGPAAGAGVLQGVVKGELDVTRRTHLDNAVRRFTSMSRVSVWVPEAEGGQPYHGPVRDALAADPTDRVTAALVVLGTRKLRETHDARVVDAIRVIREQGGLSNPELRALVTAIAFAASDDTAEGAEEGDPGRHRPAVRALIGIGDPAAPWIISELQEEPMGSERQHSLLSALGAILGPGESVRRLQERAANPGLPKVKRARFGQVIDRFRTMTVARWMAPGEGAQRFEGSVSQALSGQ